MAVVDLKPSSRIALVHLVFLFCLAVHGANGACDLPEDLRGTWVDSLKGTLEFDNTTIRGYDIFTFGEFALDCYNQNGSTYVMESNSFMFFSLNFSGYFCWSFTKVTDDLYYYYEHAEPLKDAGYEKVKMYLPITTPVIDDICYDPSPGLGTYRVLYRNDSLLNILGQRTCPSALQKMFAYNMTLGGELCTGSSSFDGCDNVTSLAVTDGNCSTTFGYSLEGDVGCLVDISSGSLTYMTLANKGSTVDNNSTFALTCLIIDTSSSPYQAVQYPTQCPDDMNITFVYGPGAYVSMAVSEDCPVSTTPDNLWIIGAVMGGLILLVLLVLLGWLCMRKREKDEEEKKLEIQRAEDDQRYSEDDQVNTRGNYPPSVTIAIMEGRSRGTKDMLIDDEDGDRERSQSFVTSGAVTPSGIQPTYDAAHRKFSKRRRVWVIGEDGSVVKEYKEPKDGKDGKDDKDGKGDKDGKSGQDGGKDGKGGQGGKDGKKGKESKGGKKDGKGSKGGKNSPDDSGVEDEGEGTGDKSKANNAFKYLSGQQNKEEDEKDFQKQYGRQDVKEAKELTERGDMATSSSKLFSRIRSLAGIKSFAMARKKKRVQSTGSQAKNAKVYKQKGGRAAERDGNGSDSSHHSDAGVTTTSNNNNNNINNSNSNNNNNNGSSSAVDESLDDNRVIDLRAQRAAMAMTSSSSSSLPPSTASKEKDGGGGKRSDKGRNSPDSGTGRDSGLSYRSASSTSSHRTSPTHGTRSGEMGGAAGTATAGGAVGAGSVGSEAVDNAMGGAGQGTRPAEPEDGRGGKGKATKVADGRSNTDGTTTGGAGSGLASGGAAWTAEGNSRGGRVSRSRSDRTGLKTQGGGVGTALSNSKGRRSPDDGEFVLRDIPEDRFPAKGAKGGKSAGAGGGGSGGGGGRHVSGSGSAGVAEYGAGRLDNVLVITPRDGGGKGLSRADGGGGKASRQGRSKKEEGTVSAIDIDNNILSLPVEPSRPPTGHQKRRGWQDDDTSRSRSRSRERKQQQGEEKDRDTDLAADRSVESRSVRWREEDSSNPGTADGRRSVRWKDGSSAGDSVSISTTSGMGIRRYPDSDAGSSTPSRASSNYGSLSRLARVHRKKKAVAPLLEDPSVAAAGRSMVQRPPDMDDLQWKRLLEELYPDKKYLDYAKASSEKPSDEEAFVRSKAEQGLGYLYDRARFWQNQEPLVRPGTSLSIRSVTGDSRAPSAVPPPSSRGHSRAGV